MSQATNEELEELANAPTYGRFALRGDSAHGDHWIVALRNCFMVDARAVADALPSFVVRSTTDPTRTSLANQWAAFAVRHGPIVAADNLGKFAEALHYLSDESGAENVALGLAEIAAVGWAFEGGAIEHAGQVAEDGGEMVEVMEALDARLAQLEGLVPAARDALDRARRGVGDSGIVPSRASRARARG